MAEKKACVASVTVNLAYCGKFCQLYLGELMSNPEKRTTNGAGIYENEKVRYRNFEKCLML